MTRIVICLFAVVVALTFMTPPARAASRKPLDKPNVVVIFADDLGYGDLSVYGHPTIRTPHLDRMAAEGQRWTDFYVAACVCTPSRAALLTGRLPIRSGMTSSKRRVLFHYSKGGLPASEVTIAEGLKDAGYATACVGKWHLGHLPPYLPGAHGFDYYFGIPYSNDMDRVVAGTPKGRTAFKDPKIEYWNVPLIRNAEVIERPAEQTTITRRYTEEAVKFIREHKDGPFFVYLAHSMPHVPLFRSKEFEGRSRRGLYGDVIEEIDWSVGQVLDTLRREGLAENTLVMFTSDNGPWLIYNEQGGSAGLLREGKGSTWDGGMREPFVAWWPGTIKPALIHDMGSTLDFLPTVFSLAGVKVPTDRVIDGYDLSPVLMGKGKNNSGASGGPRDHMFFYRDDQLFAVRQGPFKAHFKTQSGYGQPKPEMHEPPLLFNLDIDPSEQYNVAEQHADIIAVLTKLAAEHEKTIEPVENQLEK